MFIADTKDLRLVSLVFYKENKPNPTSPQYPYVANAYLFKEDGTSIFIDVPAILITRILENRNHIKAEWYI